VKRKKQRDRESVTETEDPLNTSEKERGEKRRCVRGEGRR